MTMTAAKLAHSLFVTNKHQSDAIIIQFSSAFYIQYASNHFTSTAHEQIHSLLQDKRVFSLQKLSVIV